MSERTGDYAGDVDVSEAWNLLSSDPKAQLVDVRTAAEWTFVGLPDLSGLGRAVHTIEWQSFPAMEINTDFIDVAKDALRRSGVDENTPLLMLCRSGARSRAAATALTRAGFKRAYNIAGGFEGNLDHDGHRGSTTGWKAAGLPWRQG
jgi:rhodanese-related sulfurtransferase